MDGHDSAAPSFSQRIGGPTPRKLRPRRHLRLRRDLEDSVATRRQSGSALPRPGTAHRQSTDGPPALPPACVAHRRQEAFAGAGRTDLPHGPRRAAGRANLYLLPNGAGKATAQPSKRTLGRLQGGGVWLGEVMDTVVVAEGIETALSVQCATGIPAVATLSATRWRASSSLNVCAQC